MKETHRLPIRILEHFLVLGLAIMGLMVLGNVVLRYVFNSGIAVSEEISRFIFVWLTFVGAVVAMKEGLHLGMEFVVSRLPPRVNYAAQIVSCLLMLICCALLLKGSWTQTVLNINNKAALSGIPVAVFYSAGIFASLSFAWIILGQLRTAVKNISNINSMPKGI